MISARTRVIDWREGENTKCPVCGSWSAVTRSLYTDYCPNCNKTVRYYVTTWTIENGDATTKDEIRESRVMVASCCDRCIHLDGKNNCQSQHTHIRHPYKTTCEGFHPFKVRE